MDSPNIHILHYSSPPVVGGVESVILAHTRLFLEMGYHITVLTGNGAKGALPDSAGFIRIPWLDSKNQRISLINRELEQGRVPENFEPMLTDLEETLRPVLNSSDLLIVHNVFTKHFNLALTAALFQLLDQGVIKRCVAWCHDFTWTSPHSRSQVYPGYPWDLLRTRRPDVSYVTVSQSRQIELAALFGCPPEVIRVIYNGVNAQELLGISDQSMALIDRLGLWDSDLNLLMPIRVTQAKNIELAIGAAVILREHGVHPKIIITGPPDPHDDRNMEYFENLKAMRAKSGVENEVRFVYESGKNPDEPFQIDMSVVGDLFRVSDALLMPSLREGFGMPILEAGLVGIPIFSSDHVPAAKEIGDEDVILFSSEAGPEQVAALILNWLKQSHLQKLRVRVRQRLTWKSIFQHQILQFLNGSPS